jgi:hypothetical protein
MEMNQADAAQAISAMRETLSTETWEGFFTDNGLLPFVPKIGSMGLEPTVEAFVTHEGQQQLYVIPVGCDEWNVWEGRTTLLRQVGVMLAKLPGIVLAFRLGSEAWMRGFSEQEAQEFDRRKRQVSSYDDKYEIIMCMGLTLDGRMGSAIAKVERDKRERICRIDKWMVRFDEHGEKLAPQMHLLMYLWEGYREGKIAERDEGNDHEASPL